MATSPNAGPRLLWRGRGHRVLANFRAVDLDRGAINRTASTTITGPVNAP